MGERANQRGFTLVEMIVSITIIGVLASVAVPMLRLPLTSYLDAQRRSELAAEIDATTQRLRADLARAMPGSVRVRQVGARHLLEYLEVRATGRYRSGPLAAGAPACPAACLLPLGPLGNDVLELNCADTCFTTLGPLEGDVPVPGTDYLVVDPLGPGVAGGDPYLGGAATPPGGVKTRLTGIAAAPAGQRLSVAPFVFTRASVDRRFYIVATPVTWDCDPATARLSRRWGYPIAVTQPAAFAAAVPAAPLATSVAACRIGWHASGPPGRGGVVNVWMRVARGNPAGSVEAAELMTSFNVREGS